MTTTPAVSLGAGFVSSPLYFASISSLKARLAVSSYVRILLAAGYGEVLVSAYDLDALCEKEGEVVSGLLARHRLSGGVLFIDSGGYEASWLHDRTWSAEKFKSVVERHPATVVTTFDLDQQDEPDDSRWLALALAAGPLSHHMSGAGSTSLPIVHAPSPERLVARCRTLVQETKVSHLAVAERELGDGLVERARTLAEIRQAIDEHVHGCFVHVLGTGAPLSLAVYAQVGANSFDGLEWCRTAIVPETGRLLPFHHYELALRDVDPALSGPTALMLQNLRFYQTFMAGLREVRASGVGEWLLAEFPEGVGRDFAMIQARLRW